MQLEVHVIDAAEKFGFNTNLAISGPKIVSEDLNLGHSMKLGGFQAAGVNHNGDALVLQEEGVSGAIIGLESASNANFRCGFQVQGI